MRKLVPVWVVAALTMLVGCSAAGPRGVQRINPTEVPFGLLATAPAGIASLPATDAQADIYFVRDDRLTRVRVPVAGANRVADALRAVLNGPTTVQVGAGFRSAIPAQTRLVSLDAAGTVATIDLSAPFGNVGGAEQVLAVAQLVYTVTSSPEITAVRFAIAGKPIDVPDGGGSLSGTPRVRADYRRLAAP